MNTKTIETSARRWVELELNAALDYYRCYPRTAGAVSRLIRALDDYRKVVGALPPSVRP
jgi:hypothetical protein